MIGINSLVRWLKRKYGIRVLMVDSVESLANASGDRAPLLRASEQLQAVAENLGLCLVAASHSMGIYKSVRQGAVIDADGYEW